MEYTEPVIIQLLKENLPIAICNGTETGRLPYFENCFASWLKQNNLPYALEENLYQKASFDLSQYKTIAFSTQGEEKLRTAFENIIKSFSKENLKVVIVGNQTSYLRVKDLANKLGIQLIYFDYYVPMMKLNEMNQVAKKLDPPFRVDLDDVWDTDIADFFFDPKATWR